MTHFTAQTTVRGTPIRGNEPILSRQRTPRRWMAMRQFVLPAVVVAVVCAMVVVPAANAFDREEIHNASENLNGAVIVRATVLNDLGIPVEGAVVVTSAGGQGVSDQDGRARFAIDPDSSIDGVQVTAVASLDGVNHIGSVRVDSRDDKVDVGDIMLLAGGDCDPTWVPSFGGGAGTNNVIRALAVFDSGSGPSLYAGGSFTTAGGVNANYIARWDGISWSPLGSGLNGPVFALSVFNGGSGSGAALYVGGQFTEAGGVTANGIARWGGTPTSWSSLDTGVTGCQGMFCNTRVHALAVYNDGSGQALYAGGNFTAAGSASANFIARWNGTSWSTLGPGASNGVNSTVRALTVFNDGSGQALFVGGFFDTAGNSSASRIARWDGTSWSPLGTGISSVVGTVVFALAVFNDGSGQALYAGGVFPSAGGISSTHIARWDGAAWSAVGGGMNQVVSALTVFNDGSGQALYAGGNFTAAGGTPANGIAKWDGMQWSALSTGASGWVMALAVVTDMLPSGGSPALYVGGDFFTAGGQSTSNIARWGCPCSPMWNPKFGGGNGANDLIRAMTVFDDGQGGGPALYVGGDFTSIGGIAANHIARWDGTSWMALDSGTNGPVRALAVFDDGLGGGPALYAGGDFTTAGGNSAVRIARWDGTSWSPLGGGSISSVAVYTLQVFDDGLGGGSALYVGGNFTTIGAMTVNHIARWNGTTWSPLGTGMDSWVTSMTVFDDGQGGGPALYVGGNFTAAGPTSASRIARWDGTSWSTLNDGVNDTVFAMAAFDAGFGPELYVGGWFNTADGMHASNVAMWDGNWWSEVGFGTNGWVFSMEVFDDNSGRGPALYIGGVFSSAGLTPARRIARLDGKTWTWSPLGSGITGAGVPWPYVLHVFNDGSGKGPAIYAGGQFNTAGDHNAENIAMWSGCCRHIDLNCDGVVDGADMLILLSAWGQCPPDPYDCPADLDGNGQVDGADLLILLSNWG